MEPYRSAPVVEAPPTPHRPHTLGRFERAIAWRPEDRLEEVALFLGAVAVLTLIATRLAGP